MQRNPYLNRSMIRTVGEFRGRRREVQRIMALIGAQTPQSVSLVGERRAGKSTLLWHISQPEVYEEYLEGPERYVFMMMDFQGHQHLDQRGFCHVFAEHLAEVVAERLEVPEVEDLSGLEGVFQAIGRTDLRLVCLFDEFETVTRNADFGAEFFGFLRSMANTFPVAFITASRRELENLCHNQQIAESPFFNIFTRIPIGPMSEAEVRDLIVAPSAAAEAPLEEHADFLVGLSGHLPFFVQMACAAAFDCLVESGGQEVDHGEVERRFLEEATSHFHYLWENYTAEERQAIEAVLQEREPLANLSAVLRALETHGYVRRAGEQRELFSRVFSQFLQEYVAAASAAAPDVPAADDGGEPAATAGEEPFGRLMHEDETAAPRRGLVYTAISIAAVGVVLLALYLFWPGDSPPSAPSAAGVAAARQGIEIVLYYREVEGYKVAGEQKVSVEAAGEIALGAGDEYRFDCASAEKGYLYAYLIDGASGAIVHLPDASSAQPTELRAGATHTLPAGRNQWLHLEGQSGSKEIYLIVSRARNLDLEEKYDRFRRASVERKREFGIKLVEEIVAQKDVGRDGPRGVYYHLLTLQYEGD